MRAALRLLASVRYLEPGTPTGLTGLFTHPSPRSTLIYLYSSTLDKLKQVPESSVYRQSTEALTRHRLQIVEKAKPEGYEAWQERVKKQIEANPEAFGKFGVGIKHNHGGREFVTTRIREEEDERETEWNNEEIEAPELEGTRSLAERKNQRAALGEGKPLDPRELDVVLEPEPRLTAEQISGLEAEIGAGLIEEVIEVAEGEHLLVNHMIEAKVWEELEDKAPEGQWIYFERMKHHTMTQKP